MAIAKCFSSMQRLDWYGVSDHWTYPHVGIRLLRKPPLKPPVSASQRSACETSPRSRSQMSTRAKNSAGCAVTRYPFAISHLVQIANALPPAARIGKGKHHLAK